MSRCSIFTLAGVENLMSQLSWKLKQINSIWTQPYWIVYSSIWDSKYTHSKEKSSHVRSRYGPILQRQLSPQLAKPIDDHPHTFTHCMGRECRYKHVGPIPCSFAKCKHAEARGKACPPIPALLSHMLSQNMGWWVDTRLPNQPAITGTIFKKSVWCSFPFMLQTF